MYIVTRLPSGNKTKSYSLLIRYSIFKITTMKSKKVPATHKQELIAQIQLLRIVNERNIPDLAMIHRIVGKMK